MTRQRSIFTEELLAAARAQPEAKRRLIHRWATFSGPGREEARCQLDAAADLVPPGQRPRVLRPLYSSDDKQVFAAAGVLLLAKVLHDQSWAVEFEPKVFGVTPDLRIRKREATFLVEARHVEGDLGLPPAYQRLQAELRGMRTRTPASFSRMEVDGRASLKGFKAFLRLALDEERAGSQLHQESGVLIQFELHLPPLESETEVFFAYSGEGCWFDDRPAVEAALDEKLKKYPFPLVVALQGIHTGDLFSAAEDALFGTVVYEIPISHKSGGPAGPARMARKPDAVVARKNADGDRVRSRLEALLPFEVRVTDNGFAVQARVLANPAKQEVAGLREFCPIPSLLRFDQETFCYHGADGEPRAPGTKVADLFFP